VNAERDDAPKYISEHQLYRTIVRAGQIRSILSMIGWVPLIAISGLLMQAGPIPEAFGPIFLFGSCLLLEWGLTHLICHRMVKCPFCGASLWNCGTGNFKPRRLRLKPDAKECPTCHAPFGW
jgi:hypothetical protein